MFGDRIYNQETKKKIFKFLKLFICFNFTEKDKILDYVIAQKNVEIIKKIIVY